MRVTASICALVVTAGSALAQCPSHAHVTRVEMHGDVRTTHCACDAGFESANGACLRKVTIMRPATGAECVRLAGHELADDLDQCKAPFLSVCMSDPAANEKVATCLTIASLIKFDPNTVTVLGALIACGFAAPDAAKVVQQCPEVQDSCLRGALAKHKSSVGSCGH